MRRHLLSAIALALALLVSPMAGAQPQGILRVAVDGSYPPYSSVDSKGRLTGFDIEMADEICKRIEMKCTKVRLTWDEMLDAVNKHKADMVVASTSITNGRRLRGIAFSERYYHTPAMFVRRKNDDAVEGIRKALRGKTIGVQGTTTHDQFVTSEYVSLAKIKRYQTLPEMVKALLNKEVDIIFADAWALDRQAINGKNGKKLEFTGPAYNDRRWFGEGIGVVLPKDDARLKNNVDQAIRSMRSDGTYMTIAKKYFSFDPYGD